MLEGFEHFADLTREIPCDAQSGGHLSVAHNATMLKKLEAETEVLNRVFGYKARMMDVAELARDWVDEFGVHGAQHEPLGIGVQPAKLAFKHLRAARAAGATVHTASPVEGITPEDGHFRVRTPGGTLRARAVAIATAITPCSLKPDHAGVVKFTR